MEVLLLLDLEFNSYGVLWNHIAKFKSLFVGMWRDQVDEWEALQSIYGEHFSFVCAEHVPGLELDSTQGDPQGIDFEALRMDGEPSSPDWKITCRICLAISNSCLNVGMVSEEGGVLKVGHVEHVPPVELRCTCTASGHEVTVSACWMCTEDREKLKHELQQVYQDMDGQPAIFACCEHARCCLDELETLVISSNHVLRIVFQYNDDMKQKVFEEGIHSCVICYEEVPGSRCYRLGCDHVYCCACLEEKLRIDITEGNLDAIRCPTMDCKKDMEPHEIKDIVNSDIFERWESLTLKRALETMAGASFCPRCSSLALEDVTDNSADCPKCLFVFCTLCEEARHPGVECVGPETKLQILREKARGGGQAAIQELRKKEQEYKSLIEVKKTSKPCPCCGIAIQRTEGCNKMTCSSCGAYFCWKCNADISTTGYDHFKEGGTCVLFNEEEILRWERHMAFQHAEMGFIPGDYQGQVHPPREERENPQQRAHREPNATNCPNCGQVNYKINRNNHIHCWSCSKYYCGLCRLVLQRRGGTHFSKDGCPQHSTT